MSDLPGKILKTIQSRKLIRPRQSVLVAVSGGLDSMVLLHVLQRLANSGHWKLAVAHFNHQLRGRSSDADEQLVRRTARTLGLPFFRDSADVREIGKQHGISVEMAARRLRHDFLARTGLRQGFRTVALAHHADDQVELCFLRFLRGAGGEGLAGMRWKNPSPANKRIRLVRPLLESTKQDLRAWALREAIRFREDPSNAETDYQRNRVRCELVPMLQKRFQPALVKTTLRLMEIVGAESEFAEACARSWGARKSKVPFGGLHAAVQRQWIRLELMRLGLEPNFDLIESLRGEAERRITVMPQTVVWRDQFGQLRLSRPSTKEFILNKAVLDLSGGAGIADFGGVRVSWAIEPRPKAGRWRTCYAPGRECFDADRIGTPIVLRHWQPGDRFQPIGMSRPVKLQDLFTNEKTPRDQRRQLVLAVANQGEIFWVEGCRISENFKLRPRTDSQLLWSWKRK